MSRQTIRVGARGSRLSRIQAESVISKLRQAAPEYEFELVVVKTSGDSDRQTALSQLGGQGVFVKELEAVLLRRDLDLAVHSAKDLPSYLPEGLTLAAVPERLSVADVLISSSGWSLEALPGGSRIATGSPRRRAFVKRLRKDLQFVEVRGNVDTRLRKLEAGEFDAIILAEAGLQRLDIKAIRTYQLSPQSFLPAPGQGALAVESRQDDVVLECVSRIDSTLDHACLRAERALIKTLQAGCNVPLGAWARLVAGKLRLEAMVCDAEAQRVIQSQGEVEALDQAEELGQRVAADLIQKGATEILHHAR